MENTLKDRTVQAGQLLLPLWLIAAFIIGVLLRDASIIFLWIVSSFFLFAFLDPWMQRLNRRGIAPVISAVTLVTLVSLSLLGLGFLIYRYSPALLEQLEAYRKVLLHLYGTTTATVTQWLDAMTPAGKAVKAITTEVTQVEVVDHSPLNGSLGSTMLHGIGTALTALTFGILCPILTFFMIAERSSFASVFGRLFQNQQMGGLIWKRITDATGAFFLGNFTLAAVCFPIFAGVFYLFGVDSPLPLAALASIVNLVPFLGAALSGALPALGLLANQGSAGAALGLLGLCLLIHFTVANLVTPKILGSKLDLNATTSTIALIAWGELWGGLGLLLAIPLTASIKIVFQYSGNARLHWIAMLMSDDPQSILNQSYRQLFPNKAVVTRLGSTFGISKRPAAVDVNPAHQPPSDTQAPR